MGHIELRTNSKILQKNKKKKTEINELGTPKIPSNEHITIPLTKQKERSRSKLRKAIDQKLILMKRVTLNWTQNRWSIKLFLKKCTKKMIKKYSDTRSNLEKGQRRRTITDARRTRNFGTRLSNCFLKSPIKSRATDSQSWNNCKYDQTTSQTSPWSPWHCCLFLSQCKLCILALYDCI